MGSIVSLVVLQAFKETIIAEGAPALNICWRILAGFGAIPALAAVYWRLTIPETPRYAMDVLEDVDRGVNATEAFLSRKDVRDIAAVDTSAKDSTTFGAYRKAFASYFSRWVNLKVLLGCSLTWFFLDIG